jgi:rhodanese-related sulfurtransferase
MKPARIAAALLALGVFSRVDLLSPSLAVAQNYPRSVSELVARTKAQIKTINMATFRSALDKSELGLIVDVREPGEYSDGHIPGAINIPRGQIEFSIWRHVGFPDNTNLSKKMTLYCGTGGRCALATKSLQDLGFSDVTAADMKIEDWTRAGYPLVKK